MKQVLFIFTIGFGVGAYTMPILSAKFGSPEAPAKVAAENAPTPPPKVLPWFVPRDIPLRDGRTYRNATIHSVRADGIMVQTAGGIVKVDSHLLDASTIQEIYAAKDSK